MHNAASAKACQFYLEPLCKLSASPYLGAAASPAVTKHPESAALHVGQNAVFTVKAAGAGTLSYQWQYNNGAGWKESTANGAKTATLKVGMKASYDQTKYRCIVTSSNGTSAVSDTAVLRMKRITGDADLDGILDVSDAVLAARFVNEDYEAVVLDNGKQNADCNRDGSLTADDLTIILKAIAKLIEFD